MKGSFRPLRHLVEVAAKTERLTTLRHHTGLADGRPFTLFRVAYNDCVKAPQGMF